MTNKNKAILYAYKKGYRINKNVIYFGERIIKGSITREGYRMFTIRIKKTNGYIMVHRLVAYQKYGNSIFKEGIQVRHLDSNKLNNHDKNIAIGTAKENASDKSKETIMKTVLIAASFAKKHDHQKIREMHKKGFSYSEIMKELNISSKGTISFIINKKYTSVR